MIITTLGLGVVIGMQHAVEADHVAAVSSVASRKSGYKEITRHGVFWGIGHTLTLLAVAGTCLVLHTTVPDRLADQLELAVGVMLMLLGAHVLYRLWTDRVHFHAHRHSDGSAHFHAHSHRNDPAPHGRSAHNHEHRETTPWRTLVIGLVHGMAGSAALVVLTASSLTSPWWGLAYVLTFGIGTTIGMALLTAIIAAPITLTARSLTLANRGLQLVIGLATIAIGASTVLELAPTALAAGI